MSEFQSVLREEFKASQEYREAYAEDFLNTWVATQCKVLREQRGMTQEQLAEKIGTKQAGVSRLENVNYSAWKTGTLRKIARALGVRLKVTFETYGTLLDEADYFSREYLRRPDFEHDPAFSAASAVTVDDRPTLAGGHIRYFLNTGIATLASGKGVAATLVGRASLGEVAEPSVIGGGTLPVGFVSAQPGSTQRPGLAKVLQLSGKQPTGVTTHDIGRSSDVGSGKKTPLMEAIV